MMEFIYISGLYMPASGGAEISMYTLLKVFAEKGCIFHVITKREQNDDERFDKIIKNIIVYRVNSKADVENVFKKIYSANKISGALTQNSWSDVAIKICQSYNCPSIYFLRAPFGELDISTNGEYTCDFVVANSIATRNYIAEKFKRQDTIIIPPVIDPDDYLIDHNTKEFITMINPIQMKGGDIFKDIAMNLPQRKFLAIKGWTHLMKNGTWNLPLLNDLSNGMGISNDPVFNITDFTGIKNVIVEDSTEDMKTVYSRTRLLLVPSITPEGGPRIAIEAMINGIPVIGSNSGNLPLTVGSGGIIIEQNFNVGNWIDAILKLDNEDYYLKLSDDAKKKNIINLNDQLLAFEQILQKSSEKN
jgi:glycosyltransferase involved in cell wall biosynthesis